ncbi:MAG: RNA methyltransferase [Croceitalea sp.]|nr:RNA methyltransferase [Croceitalea sp.]
MMISSLQNPLVKKVLLLKEKSRERKKSGLFVIEGMREMQLALKGGYEFKTILFCIELLNEQPIDQFPHEKAIAITKEVYEKLAYRGTTEGIMAIAQIKEHQLATLQIKAKNPLILVAEAPEKPGNIGALLRTADAANIDAVLIANPKTDFYNQNIIRSSVGCVFTTPVAVGTTEEIIAYLQQKKVSICCAALTASIKYTDVNFTKATAIVVGTESTGLSTLWLQNSDQNIIIPMQGEIDSMNVSVSAAILIFEAKRQRGF